MNESATENLLSEADVRHVAKLARLSLSDEQIAAYRPQLARVLEHVAELSKLDLSGVEPLAHPIDLTNRLDPDVVEDPLPLEAVLANAPAVEACFLAVPKVLG